ncbi:MAG: ribonuclease E/G, partial [Firmicutes bacterium]|nr:ribonuclease E/G [Bacillota bacterium]
MQVTRDPMGGKGPRLTTQLGLAGRYVVYLPHSRIYGVSRRLEDAERERLRGICREVRPTGAGLIVRTAAEGAQAEAIARDVRFLEHLWARVEKKASEMRAPALVYEEAELALRAVRDVMGTPFGRVVVDNCEVHRRVLNYLRAVAPELASRVELYHEKDLLFDHYGVEDAVEKALTRRVELPSGGYLIIDHTEAMT